MLSQQAQPQLSGALSLEIQHSEKMLSSKSLQLVTRGNFVLPRILIATKIPLSTSASVYSASRKSNDSRADGGSNSPPRTSQQRASEESYQRARRGAFSQPMPQLHNPFIEDPFLRTCLSNMLPPQVSSATCFSGKKSLLAGLMQVQYSRHNSQFA